MLIRRCAVVWLEPREVASFQLDDLLAGGAGVVSRLAWFAHAPHLGAAIEIEAMHAPILGALGPVDWIERDVLDARFGSDAVDALLDAGLLLTDAADGDQAIAETDFRGQGWHLFGQSATQGFWLRQPGGQRFRFVEVKDLP